jgi:predicted ATPase/DNA-binding SARP family transcriptional activator
METRWHIELFGGLRATRGDREITQSRTQKTGALLAYLACHPRRFHRRDELTDLFWPDAPPRAAGNSLSQALSSLRLQFEAVPDDARSVDAPGTSISRDVVLQSNRVSVRLNPEAFTSDLAAFEEAIHAASRSDSSRLRIERLARALTLYQGELLAGYHETWILGDRARVAEQYFHALGQIVALLEEEGDLEAALEYTKTGTRLDPLREETRRDQIRLLLALGHSDAALREYRDLERLLAEELGAEPSAATRALISRSLPSIPGRPASGQRGVPTSPEPLHLPAPLTRFFGRESELAQLRRLLLQEKRRLVTLSGAAGTGKTRLALEASRMLASLWANAVWFVPLADLRDADHLIEATRDALRLPRSPAIPTLDQVAAALARRRTLLVLDNFEHLVEEGALLLKTLLERAPTLTCLVTSRRRLGLSGEQEFPVLPLPVPEASGAFLTTFASAQLFVDRARAVSPEFQVSSENMSAVAEICRRLEGIPLALELAAARIGLLTPAQLAAHLERRLDALVSRYQDVDPRHRTLRTAVEWSIHLLPMELQRFFLRLSVFRGGWTPEAAAPICDEPHALERLEQLREWSLIVPEEFHAGQVASSRPAAREAGPPAIPGPRYRMLETLREYGEEALETGGEEATVRDRHLRWFLALAETSKPELRGPSPREWLARLVTEAENFRAALDWGEQSGDIAEGLRLGTALFPFWLIQGDSREGRQRLTGLLERAPEHTAVRAGGLHAVGELALEELDLPAARASCEESLAIRRELGDAHGAAESLTLLGHIHVSAGDVDAARKVHMEALPQAQALNDRHLVIRALDIISGVHYRQGNWAPFLDVYTESLRLRRSAGDRMAVANALANLASVASRQGDIEAARQFDGEAMAIHQKLDAPVALAGHRCFQAHLAELQGDYLTARALFEESLPILRDAGDRGEIAFVLRQIAGLARDEGDFLTARAHCEEALEIVQGSGDRWEVGRALNSLGELAQAEGERERARSLYQEGLAIQRALADGAECATVLLNLGRLARCEGDPAMALACFREALALTHERGAKVKVIQCLEGIAGTALALGQAKRAARLLGAAEAVRQATRICRPRLDRAVHELDLRNLRQALGAAAFEALRAEGRQISLDQAVAEALTTGADDHAVVGRREQGGG